MQYAKVLKIGFNEQIKTELFIEKIRDLTKDFKDPIIHVTPDTTFFIFENSGLSDNARRELRLFLTFPMRGFTDTQIRELYYPDFDAITHLEELVRLGYVEQEDDESPQFRRHYSLIYNGG